ncbi:hypothetical protein D9758_003730 [Tetrapyrgos nigripes]|uniref:Uncharacterized protein n=1 Tax=Tetrapyrgos nigripes TaxID=182062 RepID=A0A8H5LS41_9AGAR|nr:hypothetical protein D9758_003730 [Tetrapyrgos nigripes]
MHKAAHTFLANPLLNIWLATCLYVAFDMDSRPNPGSHFYTTHVDLGVEPLDLAIFHRIFNGADAQKIFLNFGPATQMNHDLWQSKRHILASGGDLAVALVVDFCYLDLPRTGLTIVPVLTSSKKFVDEKKPFMSVSRHFGEAIAHWPYSPRGCLMNINMMRSEKAAQTEERPCVEVSAQANLLTREIRMHKVAYTFLANALLKQLVSCSFCSVMNLLLNDTRIVWLGTRLYLAFDMDSRLDPDSNFYLTWWQTPGFMQLNCISPQPVDKDSYPPMYYDMLQSKKNAVLKAGSDVVVALVIVEFCYLDTPPSVLTAVAVLSSSKKFADEKKDLVSGTPSHLGGVTLLVLEAV